MAEGYKDWAAGDILTAADLEDYTVKQSVMVFADSTARTSALSSVLREGMVSYLKDTNAIEVYDGSAWVSVGGATMIKKVDAFTASGTWTVPAGVTYAIAHIRGGGGGISANAFDAGNGGSSSVAFSGGTITAVGGINAAVLSAGASPDGQVSAGGANSGQGAAGGIKGGVSGYGYSAKDGAYIVAGDTVTPAASITVTVGAGGTAGTGGAAGGSGYVWIEYYQEA